MSMAFLVFHSTLISLLVLLFYSSSSNIYCNHLYFPTFLVTSGHQQFIIINSVIFHSLLCSATSTLQCNQIISTLNFLSFGIYTFPSFNTKSSSICHSSFLNAFTSAFFISSTTLTISLSLFLAIFIFLLFLSWNLLLLLQLNYKSIVL